MYECVCCRAHSDEIPNQITLKLSERQRERNPKEREKKIGQIKSCRENHVDDELIHSISQTAQTRTLSTETDTTIRHYMEGINHILIITVCLHFLRKM